MKKQNNNNVESGNIIGRDNNTFITHLHPVTDDVVEKLKKFHEQITDDINTLLPRGLYTFKTKRAIPFDSESLYNSLNRIAIPYEIVIYILQSLPKKLSVESNLENFTTRDLRRIVYRLLQNLDYSVYGQSIDYWGENYIRKYGNPDVEITVLLDEENRPESLDYVFLTTKLLPEIYRKCYQRDISEDLTIINSRSLLKNIADEILDKVRILNLYIIRYSTLRKLATDMAIQPPHPWFTNRINAEGHIKYHSERYIKHYGNFLAGIEVKRAAQEFVEHCCAAVLSTYNLVIGVGRYRPLIVLCNYLKLRDIAVGNELYWSTLDISNIPGDMEGHELLSPYSFKWELEHILARKDSVEDHFDELITSFGKIHAATDYILKRRDLLTKAINTEISNSLDLRSHAYFLFTYYDRMKASKDLLKFDFIDQPKPIRVSHNFLLVYLFDYNSEPLFSDLHLETNSVIAVLNEEMTIEFVKDKVKDRYPSVEYIFPLTISTLYTNTICPNRRAELEGCLLKNLI